MRLLPSTVSIWCLLFTKFSEQYYFPALYELWMGQLMMPKFSFGWSHVVASCTCTLWYSATSRRAIVHGLARVGCYWSQIHTSYNTIKGAPMKCLELLLCSFLFSGTLAHKFLSPWPSWTLTSVYSNHWVHWALLGFFLPSLSSRKCLKAEVGVIKSLPHFLPFY